MTRAPDLILRLAAWLVPREYRAEWLREWRAEMDAARRDGRRVFAIALGAVPDAWAMERWSRKGRTTETAMDRAKGAGMTTNTMLGAIVHEMRRSLRSLMRAPGFTAASVLTLAVGLGATAAIVTLVDAILIRPLPYPAADRIVRVYHVFKGSEGANPLARFAYPYIRDSNHSFEETGAYWSPTSYTLAGDAEAERVRGTEATPELLGVVGARPVAGRLFTAADAAQQDAAGVVISHRLWVRRYGSAPGIVGRAIPVDGRGREVLGVMAPGVDLPDQKVDLWIPYEVPAGVRVDDSFRLQVLARMRPGVDVESASADMAALTARFPDFASFYSTFLNDYELTTRVRPVRDEVVGNVERPLWILLGAVTIVLLVAVANVATLFLVRAEGRRQEVAVRAALGAGRSGLIGHFLSESLQVALSAGAVAFGIAWAAVRLFRSLAPPAVPRLDEIQVGWPTAAVLLVLSLGIAFALGLYPFLRFACRDTDALRARTTGDTRAQAAIGGGLVAAQVALALVLLSGSALLVQSYRELRAVDPGFDPRGVLMADFSLPATDYPSTEEVRLFQDQLVERVRGLPGVQGTALGVSPLGHGGCNGMYVEGMVLAEGQFPPCVPVVFVSPTYWEVLGIPHLAGRAFEKADMAIGAPTVVVASEGAARQLWPEGDPLTGAVHPSPRPGPPWFQVVGVAEDVRSNGPDQPATQAIYLPIGAMAEQGWLSRTETLLVKTAPGQESAIVPGVRSVIAAMDPSVPLTVRGSLADEQARTISRSTFTLFLLGTAAATALVLSLVGLYGVVAYRVGRRRAEIGLRMAMGARSGEVRIQVLRHSMKLVAIGVVIGLGASILLTRALSSLLFGVRPGDPVALTTAAVALLVTALAATWIPAQRATRVDPATALRNEG